MKRSSRYLPSLVLASLLLGVACESSVLGISCLTSSGSSLYLFTEIVDEAEHFYHFGTIYDKVHKARGLGETSDNIST